MLLIRTVLAPSAIHGLGVMAAESVAAGQPIWRFEPGIDLVIPASRAAELPPAFRAYLDLHGYRSPEFADSVVLSCDHAKFLNHSDDPNTEIVGRETLARRAIADGEEITCNYRLFVSDWSGFDPVGEG